MTALTIAIGVVSHFAALVGANTVASQNPPEMRNIGILVLSIGLFGVAFFWARLVGFE